MNHYFVSAVLREHFLLASNVFVGVTRNVRRLTGPDFKAIQKLAYKPMGLHRIHKSENSLAYKEPLDEHKSE